MPDLSKKPINLLFPSTDNRIEIAVPDGFHVHFRVFFVFLDKNSSSGVETGQLGYDASFSVAGFHT
jgi:hypothetical protein